MLRVNNISDLFYMAEVLAKQPPPKGPKLTILTNAGGPAVLATDALITSGGELTELSKETFAEFNTFLPASWSRNNPVDIIGDATPERYAKALDTAAKDPNSDGMLVILTPQDMTDPTQIAEQLKPYANMGGKPVLASWMGGPEVAAGESILNAAGIPTFAYPDTAARMFTHMWHYSANLRSLYETPVLAPATPERTRAEKIIQDARQGGRTILTEFESKQVLAAYGIPIVETRVAKTEQEAVKAAGEIGYPVVLKLFSETITHKTDVGGVQLNLKDAEAVRRGLSPDRIRGEGKGRRRPLPRSHGPADDQAGGLRDHPGQQPGPAVRTGDPVRAGRPVGRGVQGPGPRPAAAEHDAGAPHDGEDQDLHGAEGSARAQVRGSGRAGADDGPLQPAGRRTALDQGDRHQPDAGFAGSPGGPRRARRGA